MWSHRGIDAKTTSGADGQFEFTAVVPGEYSLACPTDIESYRGYLPIYAHISPDDPFADCTRQFTVGEEDVTDIECEVFPCAVTRFSGRVTTPEGTPVEGACITLGKHGAAQNPFCESENVSDKNGIFSFSMIKPLDDIVHKDEIFAVIARTIEVPSNTVTGMGNIRYGTQHCARGSCPIEYQLGDTMSDIHIVVMPVDTHHTLEGRIETEDGVWPIQVRVEVSQKNRGIPGEVDADGSYSIEALEPGPLTLHVEPHRDIGAYCRQSIKMEMPRDQERLLVNVALKKAGHCAGTVIDKNKNPIHSARVSFRGPAPRLAHTDEAGRFRCGGLQEGGEYTIMVTLESSSEPVARLEGIKPSADNIVIMVDQAE
ncbi:MAG: carboxypeptidase-like regulatory domain-containing protein [bacterium]